MIRFGVDHTLPELLTFMVLMVPPWKPIRVTSIITDYNVGVALVHC